MKKILTLLVWILVYITFLNAQDNAPPQALSYKAVINKANGAPVPMQVIRLKVKIYKNNTDDPDAYLEELTAKTDITGRISIEIGKGTPLSGTFSKINWGDGIFYLNIKVDVIGGTNYQDLSTTQLLSVPYALYAAKAGPKGDKVGDMRYWNGTKWILLPIGSNGKILFLSKGVPTWR
jgi:hypothetical protein